MGVIKDRLIEALDKLPANGVLKTSRGDNTGTILGRIFVWQETSKHAEAQLKGAWQAAVAAELVPIDDQLREVSGERTYGESKYLTIDVKVDKPREKFDLELFIATIAKRFKIDPGKLNAIAIDCKAETKAPLSKRVVERDVV